MIVHLIWSCIISTSKATKLISPFPRQLN